MIAIWGNLLPLGSNSKYRKVANGYGGIEPRTLGCHFRTQTTSLTQFTFSLISVTVVVLVV